MTELVRVVSLVVLLLCPFCSLTGVFYICENQLALIRDLDVARIQGRQWRDETRALLKGLGEAINRQFLTWKLTQAERDVGLLILKGLSLKEIAAVRVTSDRTIRAQARSLYAKAGLSGRAALSAFFLEDLLAPIEHVNCSADRVTDRQAKPSGAAARNRLSKRDSSPLRTQLTRNIRLDSLGFEDAVWVGNSTTPTSCWSSVTSLEGVGRGLTGSRPFRRAAAVSATSTGTRVPQQSAVPRSLRSTLGATAPSSTSRVSTRPGIRVLLRTACATRAAPASTR